MTGPVCPACYADAHPEPTRTVFLAALVHIASFGEDVVRARLCDPCKRIIVHMLAIMAAAQAAQEEKAVKA
jgi:hypothetical protein